MKEQDGKEDLYRHRLRNYQQTLQNCPKNCLKTAPEILQKLSLKLSTKINLPKLQKHNKLRVYDAHTNQQYSHK